MAFRTLAELKELATRTKDRPTHQEWSDIFDTFDSGSVNVKAFANLVVNGDWTAAINAAKDTGAKELLFSDETFLVTGLTANVADQKWKLSKGATITLANSSDAPVITISADGVSILGGTIDGNKANQTIDSPGIYALDVDRPWVEGVHVKDTQARGIHFENCGNFKIKDNWVLDTDNIGIFAEVTSIASKERGLISGNEVDRSSLGIGVNEGGLKVHGDDTSLSIGRVKVIGNDVFMPTNPTNVNAICLEVWGLSPYSAVSANTTSGGYMGISAARSDYVSITGNTVYNPSSIGIELAVSNRSTISGNTVDGNDLLTIGIFLTDTNPQHNAISGNTVSRCTDSTIKLINGSDYTAITGNTLSTDAEHAIEILTSQYCTVSGNTALGNGTAKKAVMLDRSDRATITGNTFHDFTETGVFILANTAITLDFITITGNVFESVRSVVTASLSGGGALGENCMAVANPGIRFGAGIPVDIVDIANNVLVGRDAGTPESRLSGNIGSIYQRRDGGAVTSFYVKESGTGSTGWVAK